MVVACPKKWEGMSDEQDEDVWIIGGRYGERCWYELVGGRNGRYRHSD